MEPNAVPSGKHEPSYPTSRTIRRACDKELYRAAKRLKHYVSPECMKEAVQLYHRKVLLNLMWVTEHRSNRKLLCDWWDEEVCAAIAALWEVEEQALSRAFRESFGG
ncbi:dehydrogenase [Paenibacillus sp. IB182496]|uniref:Dehydrogenase n=1 Tax=Paenibacillus sabuli TaxID=2772509 RepID=A0A927BS41_9BACL|nr:dehydrogenase [Paenibacillus sabuli]MBD2844896.1 dehydrogenase [Paenibacillus sabuli]